MTALEQRLTALERANDIRFSRARAKRQIKTGEITVPDLLDERPDWLLTARVFDVVTWIPGYGGSRATRSLSRSRISPASTVGQLTMRQIVALQFRLEGPSR